MAELGQNEALFGIREHAMRALVLLHNAARHQAWSM